jgi:hypothetical protein
MEKPPKAEEQALLRELAVGKEQALAPEQDEQEMQVVAEEASKWQPVWEAKFQQALSQQQRQPPLLLLVPVPVRATDPPQPPLHQICVERVLA